MRFTKEDKMVKTYAVYGEADMLWFSYSDNGIPRGVVALNRRTEEVQCLIVDTPFRRKGIATALMKALEAQAKEIGITRVFATTALGNETAQAFFAKLGYDRWFKYNKVLK